MKLNLSFIVLLSVMTLAFSDSFAGMKLESENMFGSPHQTEGRIVKVLKADRRGALPSIELIPELDPVLQNGMPQTIAEIVDERISSSPVLGSDNIFYYFINPEDAERSFDLFTSNHRVSACVYVKTKLPFEVKAGHQSFLLTPSKNNTGLFFSYLLSGADRYELQIQHTEALLVSMVS